MDKLILIEGTNNNLIEEKINNILKKLTNYEYIKYDLKQKMKEKLLNRKNILMDLYIEKEINTKDILGIYEVKKIDEYYYITNFIKNENFKDE